MLRDTLRSMPIVAKTAIAGFDSSRGPRKVFAIGFNKTGTSSLHRLFVESGYHSYHGTKWRNTGTRFFYSRYDCFCDGVPDDFRKLDRMFPGAKFILQVRDLDAWLESRLEHILRLSPTVKRERTWTAEQASVEEWIRLRNVHHAAVLEHFAGREQAFLLVNYIRDPDAPNKICRFLGRPEPRAKPHENLNPRGTAPRHADLIAAGLRNLGIPESEWRYDILCPSLLPVGTTGLPHDTSAVRASN